MYVVNIPYIQRIWGYHSFGKKSIILVAGIPKKLLATGNPSISGVLGPMSPQCHPQMRSRPQSKAPVDSNDHIEIDVRYRYYTNNIYSIYENVHTVIHNIYIYIHCTCTNKGT